MSLFLEQTFDKEQLLECIKEFVRVESKWIPTERGYSLYLRPTMIGTQVCVPRPRHLSPTSSS